mmetsp:Transcript_46734/g.117709  ORF Transcript_46734/g.117709 Transcript_46734/m.117709 type:complete len:170 (-) Transcript_46734:556-1065(-)
MSPVLEHTGSCEHHDSSGWVPPTSSVPVAIEEPQLDIDVVSTTSTLRRRRWIPTELDLSTLDAAAAAVAPQADQHMPPAPRGSAPTLFETSSPLEGSRPNAFASLRGPTSGTRLGETCAICLETLEEGMDLREIPRCLHVFHAACLETWLTRGRACCPLDNLQIVLDHD